MREETIERGTGECLIEAGHCNVHNVMYTTLTGLVDIQ